MSSYQICVSGAARGASVKEGAQLATAAGGAIANAGHMLLTGATTGLPDFAAQGAKAQNGQSVGISPAASRIEHVKKYRLPVSCYDVILFTGLHYVGRDSILIASCDAVVSIGGRLGTLHEFTIAMEMEKPIGFLMGAGGVSTEIAEILHAAGERRHANVIFDESPVKLLKRLEAMLDAKYAGDRLLYAKASVCKIRDSLLKPI